MGRMTAYLGPSTRIGAVLERGPLALFTQGGDGADGFGVGWYPGDDQPEPLVLRSRMTPAREKALLDIPRRYTSTSFIAGLRKLAPGEMDEIGGCQPFQFGRWLFHHDGELTRFREVFERPLTARLGDAGRAVLRGTTPQELLFATWVDALGSGQTPEDVAAALEKMSEAVREVADSTEAHATLGIVIADGKSLVTLRTATNGTPPSMYTIVAEDDVHVPKTARVIATEPTFPGSWSSIDPHSLIIFTAD